MKLLIMGAPGAGKGTQATALAARYDTFVMPELGVRCVSDRPWVTIAETCECTLAHLAAGEAEKARQLFTWAQRYRTPDGRYWTGVVFPEEVRFPDDEQSTYTAAAVILAADALEGSSPTAGFFADHSFFPPLLALEQNELDKSPRT